MSYKSKSETLYYMIKLPCGNFDIEIKVNLDKDNDNDEQI